MAHPNDPAAPKPGAEGDESLPVRTQQAFTTGLPQGPDSGAQASVQADEQSAQNHGKRLERARTRMAWIFDDMLERRWKVGDHRFSRRNLAEKYVGDDETIVRKWANGRKPIPLAALLLLPDELVEELIKEIRKSRGER
jgi:hypothetical protein